MLFCKKVNISGTECAKQCTGTDHRWYHSKRRNLFNNSSLVSRLLRRQNLPGVTRQKRRELSCESGLVFVTQRGKAEVRLFWLFWSGKKGNNSKTRQVEVRRSWGFFTPGWNMKPVKTVLWLRLLFNPACTWTCQLCQESDRTFLPVQAGP